MNESVSEATAQGFPRWCIVELLGRRRLGGMVSEAELFGRKMLRIDIPSAAEPDQVLATQFYSAGALYGVTVCTEEVARREASYAQPRPMTSLQLSGGASGAEDDGGTGNDDPRDGEF